LAFFPAAAIQADSPHGDSVAVKYRTHLTRRKVHIIATIVSGEKAETILVTCDGAGNQLQLLQKAEFTAPVLDDLPCPDHFLQLVRESQAHALAFEAKSSHYRLGLQRLPGIAEEFEDCSPLGKRMFVGLASSG
jgi:hypothetical protein